MKEKQCPKKAIHSVAASCFALYPPVIPKYGQVKLVDPRGALLPQPDSCQLYVLYSNSIVRTVGR